MSRFEVVRACAIALLSGRVLHGAGVTAGNGVVVDWREVRSGDELQRDGDAYDTAELFVALAGHEAATEAIGEDGPAPAPAPRMEPVVTTWMQTARGRNRTFEIDGYRVTVDANGIDEGVDAAHEAFTRKLARLAAGLEASK